MAEKASENTDPGGADNNPDAARDRVDEQFAEELADLHVTIGRIQAELTALTTRLDELTELVTGHQTQQSAQPQPSGPPPPGHPGNLHRDPPTDPVLPGDTPHTEPPTTGAPSAQPSAENTDSGDQGDADPGDDAVAPTFILLFDADSPEEHQELLALDAWVTHVLVPTYINQVSSRQPWCAQWWDHPEARARLHALWLAWQEHTDETVGGHSGPSLWHRDHLHPAMAELRSHDGPLNACMIDPANPRHRGNRPTPVDPYNPFQPTTDHG